MRSGSVLETEEMRVQQGTHRVFGNGHSRRQDHDGLSQGERITGLASTNHSEASTILFRIWKLLSEIHQEIFRIGSTVE